MSAVRVRHRPPSLECTSQIVAKSVVLSTGAKIAERFVGLDLVVEGCAKPGHETEWRRLLERAFADRQLSEAEIARFNDISIPGYERIGAPRAGFDAVADAWIIEARKAQTPEDLAKTLK